jgi:hypothetical protein
VGCDVVEEPDQDCVVGEWDSQIASASLGITLYNDTYTGANTCSAACDGAVGSYPGANPGGGVRVETRDIRFEQKGKNGKACPDLRREQACNTQKCPKDCVGAWQNDGGEQTIRCGPGSMAVVSWDSVYQPQTYVVSENEVPPGTCVNRNKTRRVRLKSIANYPGKFGGPSEKPPSEMGATNLLTCREYL